MAIQIHSPKGLCPIAFFQNGVALRSTELSFCSKTQACYRCKQWWCYILVTPPQQSSDNPETTVQYKVWNMASHHCNGLTNQLHNEPTVR